MLTGSCIRSRGVATRKRKCVHRSIQVLLLQPAAHTEHSDGCSRHYSMVVQARCNLPLQLICGNEFGTPHLQVSQVQRRWRVGLRRWIKVLMMQEQTSWSICLHKKHVMAYFQQTNSVSKPYACRAEMLNVGMQSFLAGTMALGKMLYLKERVTTQEPPETRIK